MDILVEDLKFRILSEVDYDTLKQLCLLDKSYNAVCQSSKLWMNRIYTEFGKDYVDNKPALFTWSEYYEFLYIYIRIVETLPNIVIFKPMTYNRAISDLLFHAILKNKLDWIEYLFIEEWIDKLTPIEKQKLLNNMLRIAFMHNRIDIVKYFRSQGAQISLLTPDEQIKLKTLLEME